MVRQADLSTCIQVTVFFPLRVWLASVILLAEADATNTSFPAVQMLYFVTRSSEIIGIHLKHNYLYYNNTVNQDIKHQCLFSKLAASRFASDNSLLYTINQDIKHWCLFGISSQNGCLILRGAYFHGVLIDACNFPIACSGSELAVICLGLEVLFLLITVQCL